MSLPAGAKQAEPAPHPGTYIHATALAIGEAGVLIRGPSGAGKSRLALELIAEANHRTLFARLVGDDRVAIETHDRRLIARFHPTIAGKIESRGEGIIDAAYEGAVVIRLIVDLGGEGTPPLPRLPLTQPRTSLHGISLPHLRLDGADPAQAGFVIRHLLRMGNG
ncbi:MAG: HPr kinase/phosphatase C-terminal domain-containing protein [Methylobacteriaceae bacterium]|nr:HPr kinase/phosphatase C-terminal domain-containing protein [Methylobacteriaceae bacterium]